MAQRVETILVDDLTGEELESGETLQFTWRKVNYEIDLSDENIAEWEEAMAPYLQAARRTGGARITRLRPQEAPSKTSTTVDPAQRASVREWAHDQGLEVSKRGRISQEIYDAYEAAHSRRAG